MSKAVLISIKPKWCELIASGKKTVEVRKTKPKLDTPFKCYIYCTKAKDFFSIGGGMYAAADELYRLPTGEIKLGDSFELAADWSEKYDKDNFLNGKVIGEFVCDEILQFNQDDYNSPAYDISDDDLNRTCLFQEDLYKYGNGKTIYGWHISDLVIYDKPKDLSEFSNGSSRLEFSNTKDGFPLKWSGMKRPPQSWCYVEELGE